MAKTSEPVFILKKDMPFEVDTIAMCSAVEKVTGPETIIGAQEINGLWRIYPCNQQAREKVVLEGFTLKGVHLFVRSKNPYVVRENGYEVPATKLWISDVPISVSDDDIYTMLGRYAVQTRSVLFNECARDKETNKLSRFLTGRRYIFITLPQEHLPRETKIGMINCKLYYKEQPKFSKPLKCSKCLTTGDHTAQDCPNDYVCWGCGESGHRRGQCQIEGVQASFSDVVKFGTYDPDLDSTRISSNETDLGSLEIYPNLLTQNKYSALALGTGSTQSGTILVLSQQIWVYF